MPERDFMESSPFALSNRLWVLCAVAAALAAIALASCGKGSGNLSANCAVSSDQKDSFMARAPGFPLLVTADDQFTDTERESIQATVAEWNQKGHQFIGSDLFEVHYGSIPSTLRNMDPHACTGDLGDAQRFALVRETNEEHWQEIGFESINPAATVRCYDGDHLLTRQIIYLNPTLVTDKSMLDQAFAHEFGHALGLDHSCQASGGSSSFVGCSALPSPSEQPDHPYRLAVMYPWLKPDVAAVNSPLSGPSPTPSASPSPTGSRVSQVLGENDVVRGNCIVGSP